MSACGQRVSWFCVVATSTLLLGCGEQSDGKSYGVQAASAGIGAVVRDDGQVWTWGREGSNYAGQRGTGTEFPGEAPTRVLHIEGAVAIELGLGDAYAADEDGNVWFWGSMPLSHDAGTAWSPYVISSVPGATVVRGTGHVGEIRVLDADGSVSRIDLSRFQVGDTFAAEAVEGFEDVCHLAQSMALGCDGTLLPFGNEPPEAGGLGEGSAPLSGVVQVENGMRHTVVRLADGSVWAWGDPSGQLGRADCAGSATPVRVEIPEAAAAISTHYQSNLAVTVSGRVYYWGQGAEVVDPVTSEVTCAPVEVTFAPAASPDASRIELVYASYRSLAIARDGTVWSFSMDELPATRVPLDARP